MFLFFIFGSFQAHGDGSFSLAIESNREYLGKWRISNVKIDGVSSKVSGSIYFGINNYTLTMGCHTFYGEIKLIEQGLLAIIPKSTSKPKPRCYEKLSNTDKHFLQYFLGAFTVKTVGRHPKTPKNQIILKNPRVKILLSHQPR